MLVEMLATAVVVGFIAIALMGHVMVAQAMFTDRVSDR
jgi:hypothetical protein